MDVRDIVWLVIWLATLGGTLFLNTYLREKGRNLATKEDIQDITKRIEQVKADLSGHLWIDQERWALKRDAYRDLLEGLYGMNAAMFRLAHLVSAVEAADLEHPLWKDMMTASRQFEQGFVVAQVFLSEVAIADLNKLRDDNRAASTSTTVAGQARLAQRCQAIEQARARLIATAKEDLKFRER